MTSRHLPAGQHMAPAQGVATHVQGAGGMPPPVDMTGGGMPPAAPAPGHQGGGHHSMGQGSRRRHPQPPPPHPPHPAAYAPQYHQPMNPHMYPGYMPYAPQQYPYPMPPQYQNGAMPSPAYVAYQGYPRSPPSMPQYAPMVGVTVPPNYPRHSQPSPALSTPYQPPQAPVPIPPQTPSSTHSSQMLPPQTPPTPHHGNPMPTPPPASEPSPPPSATTPAPFYPPLPWFSDPEHPWPSRKPKSKLRRKLLSADSQSVSLPFEQHEAAAENNERSAQAVAAASDASDTPSTQAPQPEVQQKTPKQAAPVAPASVSSPSQKSHTDTAASATPTKTSTQTPPAVPLIPVSSVNAKPTGTEKPSDAATGIVNDAKDNETQGVDSKPEESGEASAPPPKAAPSSWAKLFAKPSAAAKAGPNGTSAKNAATNGSGTAVPHGVSVTFPTSNTDSVAEAIRAYEVDNSDKASFIEPRGLLNTGNMCYMNSVLQVLMFCIPFYDFLDEVGKKAAHSFKSETPLVDAMIMFMHEYRVLKSASSVDQLRRSLKGEDLEKFGEPFTPEFVYEAIRKLPRFSGMQHGHQQDAEEFLGFLLQSLDDECTHVMDISLSSIASQVENSSSDGHEDASGDWLEVGRKQKAAVTRSSGANASTPINKIFGGLLRSEFRVPGLKDSITTEPYQPLQLDIGSPEVRSVGDALRGLTRPERLQGDFNSPRGKDVQATKQVFIESLPPVLILHLKRFQFDAEGRGTVKIWKHIDYPLDLEIPREVLSRQKRQTLNDSTTPRYKLIGVVYHHGKNASGGHYTADVRRQDGQDWLHLDDTVLRRVHNKDVSEVGPDGDSWEPRRETSSPTGVSTNRFKAANDGETGDEDGWKQVTTSAGGNKKWSSVVNGGGSKSKQSKERVKDNKVAYLLFYQRV